MIFTKIYLGKFCQKFVFSYFSQLLLTPSFFKKGNSCEIKNSIYIDAMVYFFQHMTFMMTPSNDDKSDICQFFYGDIFYIVNTVYVQNLM